MIKGSENGSCFRERTKKNGRKRKERNININRFLCLGRRSEKMKGERKGE